MKPMSFVLRSICLIGTSSAFRVLQEDLINQNQSSAGADPLVLPGDFHIHVGDFVIHNQCTFPINMLAQNDLLSPILHTRNDISPGDAWHPPNKWKTKFTVCVGFQFNIGDQTGIEILKYAGQEVAMLALDGAIVLAAKALTASVVGTALTTVFATSALAGVVAVGIICPICALGGLTASMLTIYGFASGIQMVAETIIDTVSDKAARLLQSNKRVLDSGETKVPVYAFQGLMFPDDKLAQAAAFKTISLWANHLHESDPNVVGGKLPCSDETSCVKHYASRIHLVEGVAKAWVDMLNSKFQKSLWPSFHGDRHLYIRGGLSLPEYNTAVGGWLVVAYTPLFISEEATPDRYEESEFAACTQIKPGMIEEFRSKCIKDCSKSLLGKDICDARCEEKLPSSSSALGVCRGTHVSTKKSTLGEWVCCAAGPQTAADTKEGLAFPKFCLLNSDCHPPEEGNDKADGKWACAEVEIPKMSGWWKHDKTCWQAPVVADAGKDTRNLLEKWPTWTVKDDIMADAGMSLGF